MHEFRSIDDILDFAIAQENADHDFYMNLAERSRDGDLRALMEGLAVDESQHAIRLEAIRSSEATFLAEEVGSLDIAETVSAVEPHPGMSYADLLVIAMKKEKAAFRLYTNLASVAKHKAFRDVLLGLAREEAQHKLRLELEYDWVSS